MSLNPEHIKNRLTEIIEDELKAAGLRRVSYVAMGPTIKQQRLVSMEMLGPTSIEVVTEEIVYRARDFQFGASLMLPLEHPTDRVLREIVRSWIGRLKDAFAFDIARIDVDTLDDRIQIDAEIIVYFEDER